MRSSTNTRLPLVAGGQVTFLGIMTKTGRYTRAMWVAVMVKEKEDESSDTDGEQQWNTNEEAKFFNYWLWLLPSSNCLNDYNMNSQALILWSDYDWLKTRSFFGHCAIILFYPSAKVEEFQEKQVLMYSWHKVDTDWLLVPLKRGCWTHTTVSGVMNI